MLLEKGANRHAKTFVSTVISTTVMTHIDINDYGQVGWVYGSHSALDLAKTDEMKQVFL